MESKLAKRELINTDTVTKEKRSEVMSKIRSKDTEAELKVRQWLHKQGLRYRKYCKDVPGKPDIVNKKYKIAIFINGCFWHGHENCKYYRLPKSNLEYWQEKLEKNTKRDKDNLEKLKKMGWNIFVVWECQVKSNFEETMFNLLKEIEILKNKKDK